MSVSIANMQRMLTQDPGPFDPRPVTLEGESVRLEPIGLHHAHDLLEAGRDPSIWTWMPIPPLASPDHAEEFVRAAQELSRSGQAVAFAIINRLTGRAVGSTRYLSIRREHRGLEIGYTWLTPSAQRTQINTECKWLLLSHALDSLGALRVEFKTDLLNTRSQRAIERLGARREGVFRSHMLIWDGRVRDSVYYAVTRDDWPSVRSRLQAMLRG